MEASLAKSILTHAPMGVIAVDPAGLIQSANGTAEHMFGYPLVSDPQRSITTVLPTFGVSEFGDEAVLADFNSHGWAGGGGRHFDAVRADGSLISIDVQAARFVAHGQTYFTLFLQDFTPVIAAQNAVNEMRTQLIYRWRLNSMGEMAAMVAHELNQPLAAISNYLHMAGEALVKGEPDDARRDLAAAEAQTVRAGETIRHMRSLLTRDTGYQMSVDARALVDELIPLMKMTARGVGAELMVDIAMGAQVVCDRVQIQQLIMNLIRNSLDAVHDQPVKRVVLSGSTRPDGNFEFRIDDTGPGILPEIADKIFEPMTSSKADGMGVGLSICRTIVEAHGGRITHGPGRLGGAAFVFTLRSSAEETGS